MPLAGSNPEFRAKAHLQWAARYAKGGETRKALSHVGSALKYSSAVLRTDRRGGGGGRPSKFRCSLPCEERLAQGDR
jgi:hypothetical protein